MYIYIYTYIYMCFIGRGSSGAWRRIGSPSQRRSHRIGATQLDPTPSNYICIYIYNKCTLDVLNVTTY